MNIARWLYETAKRRPDAPAVRFGTRLEKTYGDFARSVSARADWLQRELDVQRGDRIAVFAENQPRYLEVLYACLWMGAIAVPINAKLHRLEAAWIIGNAACKAVFTSEGKLFGSDDLPQGCIEIGMAGPEPGSHADPVRAPAELGGDAVAWLFYTSGTTGRAKGVMLTHANLMAMSLAYLADVDTVSPGDHALYAAPISHGAGLYNFPFTRLGACHVVPASGKFLPDEIESLAIELGNLSFFAAPTMVKRMIETARTTGYDGRGLKTVVYGGGPMYAADIDAALKIFGPKFVQIFGQGECPMTITVLPRGDVADETNPNWRKRRNSVGFPQACVRVRVVDEDVRDLPPDEVGEIIVSGATVMAGYWKNPEATEETLKGGWLWTGDLGYFDEDGFLTLTDRSKDVIISGGTNIYPREVEEILLMHRGVSEVSVIGVPSAEWGEDVVAFVVRRPDARCDREELDAFCRSHMASFKKPKRYEFVDELPKNNYGKVLKTSLRERLAAASM